MTHVTCRLTVKNRDQLRNPTLGNRVWATFTFLSTGLIFVTPVASGAAERANVGLCSAPSCPLLDPSSVPAHKTPYRAMDRLSSEWLAMSDDRWIGNVGGVAEACVQARDRNPAANPWAALHRRTHTRGSVPSLSRRSPAGLRLYTAVGQLL